MAIDKKSRRRLYKIANRKSRELIPFHLRANITNSELDDIKKRNWNRCIAALSMERVLIEVFNGVIDLEKIDIVLNEWRATL